MITDAQRDLEDTIETLTGRRHCVLVGRGTTALYLALRAIAGRVGTGDAILPTILCPSVAQVALQAGFRPVFADVDLATFTLSAASVERALTPAAKVIVPVHIFGHAAPMESIIALAADRNLFVIEDAAQAIGGRCGGRAIGGAGDFSVLSFGGDKIIRAGGGGAMLTDDDDFAAAARADAEHLPVPDVSSNWSRLASLSHRNLYHAMVDLLRADPAVDVSSTFISALPQYEKLYVQGFPAVPALADAIRGGLEGLGDECSRRLQRGRQYAELLSSVPVTIPAGWAQSGVLWRFSFLVDDVRRTVAVTDALRRERVHASNHYWSLADLMSRNGTHPNTRHICPRIVNLWVDETATPEYIRRSCDIVERSLA